MMADMRYKLLGKSGLRVSELCLGTMTFGETWGWGASKDESHKQFDLFAERGGNFIDTSVNYTDGTSEEFLGEFLRGQRERFVVATKYTLTKPDSRDPNSGGNSRKNMRQSVERSLRRLQTDVIDVLYLHMWDHMTPLEEVLRGLDDLVSSGKVSYIAVSDTPAYIVSAANMLSELRGWANFIGLQIPYSLNARTPERDLLPMAKYWEMTLLPWGLLGGGVLTGKYTEETSEPTRYNRAETAERIQKREQTLRIIEEVRLIAEEVGRSRAQVAIQWVRQQQEKVQTIPILGARTTEQLADNLAVLDWSLSDEQLQRLDDVSAISMDFPHGFLDGNAYVYGATFNQIDNPRGRRR
jgi:aryl-alcohol dehydrogenase-like predicted oxidoreductase